MRAVFVSDFHLGTKDVRIDELTEFFNWLIEERPQYLYLVGDIIDGWALTRRRWYFPPSHLQILHKITHLSYQGTQIIWIPGNHDEFGRDWLTFQLPIKIRSDDRYVSADGERYLVTHGDNYDFSIKNRWMAYIGDYLYYRILWIDRQINRIRRYFRISHWSLAYYIKKRTRFAIEAIGNFKNVMIEDAKNRGFDGVIAGHVHIPGDETINGIRYLNDGDWVENCSYLVETDSGSLELRYWEKPARPEEMHQRYANNRHNQS